MLNQEVKYFTKHRDANLLGPKALPIINFRCQAEDWTCFIVCSKFLLYTYSVASSTHAKRRRRKVGHWDDCCALRAAWATESQSISCLQASAMLAAWKKQDDLVFLNEVSSVPLQQTL
ncbi:MAG TPA: hypothetical protein DDY43_01580 [Synechococcales bacterium UBA10510]|jgi:hypothetical protein|nr:hypothetical protein [Synechococcales bacterium UBA10510]